MLQRLLIVKQAASMDPLSTASLLTLGESSGVATNFLQFPLRSLEKSMNGRGTAKLIVCLTTFLDYATPYGLISWKSNAVIPKANIITFSPSWHRLDAMTKLSPKARRYRSWQISWSAKGLKENRVGLYSHSFVVVRSSLMYQFCLSNNNSRL